MTDLTAVQLRWIRSEIGDTPVDADLNVIYTDLGSVRDVALRVLGDKRRLLLDSPASVSLSGVASINQSENIKALERDIARISRMDDDPTDEPGEVAAGYAGGATRTRLGRTRGR